MSDDKSFLKKFKDLEIFLVSDQQFHYVSGGIGPYYIDLRRPPNDPDTFKTILEAYSRSLNNVTENSLIIGVPSTGVIYATGLSLKHQVPLGVIEKLNPERIHIYESSSIQNEIEKFQIDRLDDSAFLGLEDMGIVLATALAIKYQRPSAIFRRIQKGHGTSKTIEASLDLMYQEGIRHFYVANDPYYQMTDEEIQATFSSIAGSERFELTILSGQKPVEVEDLSRFNQVIEIEDLWTTGTSSIVLYHNIKKLIDVETKIVVFLDREQGAVPKLEKLKIDATSLFTISEITEYLMSNNMIPEKDCKKVLSYVSEFKDRPQYSQLLLEHNVSSVCVGLDITPGKFPQEASDTNLPNYPYSPDAAGVKQYCLDILEEISKVEGIKVIKPNLAYYNSLTDPELHQIMQTILERAHELGLLVILDTKIGDIMRTQSQYAEKYKHFDAVTAHGFMGSDSIFPITDTKLGCYVLAFTSNPSRIDLETVPVMNKHNMESLMSQLRDGMTVTEVKSLMKSNVMGNQNLNLERVYHQMTDKIIDWQYAGSVGAVIGGTPNKDGKLQELEEIVERFARKLDYLPPILIPGVGTQGGTAKDVTLSILSTLSILGWDEAKIRKEMRKVVINSSSAINYSPRPRKAAQDLVDEVRDTINNYFTN